MALRALTNTFRKSLLHSQGRVLAPASLCGGLQELRKVAPHEGSTNQVRCASQLVVRQRMKSVGNIMKITKAMKMVAAARMRGAQTLVEACRGLTDPFSKIIGEIPMSEGKSGLVPITSDKGLCGGVNSQVNKVTRALADVVKPEDGECRVSIIGDKGRSVLRRMMPDEIDYTLTEATKQTITFATASAMTEEILKKDYASTHVVYNRFQSAISFVPTVATVLSPEAIESSPEIVQKFDDYELEGPDRSEFLNDLTEFQIASTIYLGMLENGCSEQASRVQAMESSSNNASDMLNALTIKYNKTRQASITTELIEIISGAVALED